MMRITTASIQLPVTHLHQQQIIADDSLKMRIERTRERECVSFENWHSNFKASEELFMDRKKSRCAWCHFQRPFLQNLVIHPLFYEKNCEKNRHLPLSQLCMVEKRSLLLFFKIDLVKNDWNVFFRDSCHDKMMPRTHPAASLCRLQKSNPSWSVKNWAFLSHSTRVSVSLLLLCCTTGIIKSCKKRRKYDVIKTYSLFLFVYPARE